jgi:lipoic acid synthetase
MPTSSDMSVRLPADFRKSLLSFEKRREVYRTLREGGLITVCEEARCPNIGDCFQQKTATFMILGDRCTRRCRYCAVTTKKPLPIDDGEPVKVAQAARKMGLDYVVITSVDRDELPDYGARHFVRVVQEIRFALPTAKIELLVPDFRGRLDLVDEVLASPLDVFGHNIESVDRLYKLLRPQSSLKVTKQVLKQASDSKKVKVKSGMMVGVGENDKEVLETLDILHDLGVDIVTIGQYLRPSLSHWPVDRYVTDESFQAFVAHGKKIGLDHVFAGPFVRSSYHAKEAHFKSFDR